MLNKKADAGFGVKELVLWIIVIVIIVVVLMGIFVWDIPQKIKDLFPDFNQSSNESIEKESFNFCPIKIAEIKNKYLIIDNKKTNLYVTSKNIKLDKSGSDKEIGIIKTREIDIDNSLVYSGVYNDYPELPSNFLSVLRDLDGSYMPEGYDFICREKELVELKKGDKIDDNILPEIWKFESEGSDFANYSDIYGNWIMINRNTGEILKLSNKEDKLISGVWI